MHMKDRYPTRTRQHIEPFVRPDPVIYSGADAAKAGPLTAGELSSFEENGFLFIDNFISEKEVDGFLHDLEGYSRDRTVLDREETVTEPHTDVIKSVFAIHNLSSRFERLSRDERLLGMAQQLLGSDAYIHQSRINNKPAFRGTGFNWHSDFETWHSEDGMPRPRCVSFSIALDDNTEFNGPLMLIPKSHKVFVPYTGETPPQNWTQSLKSQTVGVPRGDQLKELARRGGGIVAPKGRRGSLLIFESNTLHASSNNLSPFPRRNLFFVLNSVENKLVAPYCGNAPRPEYLAARRNVVPLKAGPPVAPQPVRAQGSFLKEPAAAQVPRQ
ncbi:phytanoyl-CoA dioxygenase family protein [Tepidicaulis sp. LMO-SS28]|uniref:phytanoyl-CoA dioxygenase family protein n=1 Tax=Tepidicaulis sp. LMO-SS28 TaxID=3447455 RepID=UPI003EE34F21